MDKFVGSYPTYPTRENFEVPSTKFEEIAPAFNLNHTDATWVLLCGFVIFTMQLGFGLFEAGMISEKNRVNIMMKNIVDVVLGGFTYWLFGYGMSYGKSPGTNPFVAFGYYLFDADLNSNTMGGMYTSFLFQLSFATTATTIVSGSMAERCNFKAYCLFSLLNTIIYCIPAGWIWGHHGFLYQLGVIDIAGSGPVHLIGGASALTAAIMLGPRMGRYKNGNGPVQPGNPMMVCHGFFILWFGWLSFNSGSTYGVTGENWKYCSRAAVMTMLASFSGGMFSIAYTMIKNKGKLDMMDLINGILGGLVGITAGCFLYNSWCSLLVGLIGAILANFTSPIFDKLHIDDPVGASTVHGVCGIWGVVAIGLFSQEVPLGTTNGYSGLFLGGGWYLLGVQSLAALCLTLWGGFSTFVLLFLIDKILPLRMEEHEELVGADLSEHNYEWKSDCSCNCNQKDSNIVQFSSIVSKRNVKHRSGPSEKDKNIRDGHDNFGYEGKYNIQNLEAESSSPKPHKTI